MLRKWETLPPHRKAVCCFPNVSTYKRRVKPDCCCQQEPPPSPLSTRPFSIISYEETWVPREIQTRCSQASNCGARVLTREVGFPTRFHTFTRFIYASTYSTLYLGNNRLPHTSTTDGHLQGLHQYPPTQYRMLEEKKSNLEQL